MLNTPPMNFAGTKRMQRWPRLAQKNRLDMLDAASGGQRLPPHDQGGQCRAGRGGGHGHQPAGPWQLVRPVDDVDAQVIGGLQTPAKRAADEADEHARDDRRHADVYRTPHGIVGLIGTCRRRRHQTVLAQNFTQRVGG